MLPNKHTSKIALLILVGTVLGICVLMMRLSGNIEYPTNHLKTLNSPIDTAKMAITVEAEIRQIAQNEGFEWPDYLVRLATCESKLDPSARGDSGYSRGLFQIHKLYWPSVSDEEADSILWSTKWTMDLINAGYQHYWSCDKIIRNI